MKEILNKIKKINCVTSFELTNSYIESKNHLSITVSQMKCTSNEVEEILKMLNNQKFFQWTFNLVL
jgi:hypothetical protein